MKKNIHCPYCGIEMKILKSTKPDGRDFLYCDNVDCPDKKIGIEDFQLSAGAEHKIIC